MRRAEELVTALDLGARIETANDPFYGPASDGKRLLQRAGALKYELRLPLEVSRAGRVAESGNSVDSRAPADTRTLAVTSFNHHADHFGRAFDIRLADNTFAQSGCVALGLERWVLAFLTQYGLDERDWPVDARA
jgi:hypothetical protein